MSASNLKPGITDLISLPASQAVCPSESAANTSTAHPKDQIEPEALELEKWKPYFLIAQQIWENANNREEATRLLENLPEPRPEEFENFLAFLRTFPYFLRALFQQAAKGLPPSPGGRPRELTADERKDVCKQIGQLYGEGVELADAKLRISQHYGVSLSTVQRAWQERTRSSTVTTEIKKSQN